MSPAAKEAPVLIRFAREQSLLRVHVIGASTLENTVSYWRAIVAEVRRDAPDAIVLVDELRGEPLTAEQWLKLVEAVAGQGLESIRIAHVKPHGLQQIEYCELYAREAGFDARVFDDEHAAQLWVRWGER
ncbi:hypothetical protein [Lysobacter fragariae]